MSLVWILALAHGASVEIDGARWAAMLPPDAADETPPEPFVTWRDVKLAPVDDEVRFTGSWRIEAPAEGWYEARVTGPGCQIAEARLDGASLPITTADDGVWIAVRLKGRSVLTLRGVAAGDASREAVRLDLLPAAVGRVEVATKRQPVVTAVGPVVRVGSGIWTSGSGLALRLDDPTPPAPRPDLAVATAGLGITVGEGSYEARGRVRWEVRGGALATVDLVVAGAGPDLDVTGSDVASWTRAGDRVHVTLREPETALVELELAWTGLVPAGDTARLALPAIRPESAFRTESSLQIARDGEIEVVPELPEWTAASFAALPEWGRGLVLGTATATYTASGAPGGDLSLFRFTPVSGPPTFVDVATITAAATDAGTVLMRAHYAVRNDRAAHLRVTPPDGARIVGARVGGDTARIATDGATWLIPLDKSVETVEGLLSFPVEVVLLFDGEDWEAREARSLPLPVVDAPVAVTRATLYLPPGWSSRLDGEDADVVDAFTEGDGIAYGKGSGVSAEAEALMQDAIGAWMSNEFDDAQGYLQQLEALGGLDENARRLQSNLDVISGKAQGQYDVALERRVKEQAKARSLADQEAQEAAVEEAERAYLSGDYAAAEGQYKKALELGKKLDKLEQSESVEQAVANVALEEKVAAANVEALKQSVADDFSSAVADGDLFSLDGANISEAVATKSKREGKLGLGGLGIRGSGSGGGGYGGGGAEPESSASAGEIRTLDAAPLVVAEPAQVVVSEQRIVLRDDRARDEDEPIDVAGAMLEPRASAVFQPTPMVRIESEALRPDTGVTLDLGEHTIELSGEAFGAVTSNTEVLTRDVLERLPTGRDYQSGIAVYGEVGGVEGGVVGGVVGGVLHGAAGGVATDEPPEEPEPEAFDDWVDGDGIVDELDVMPTAEESVAVARRGSRIELPSLSVGGKGKDKQAMAPPSPPPQAAPGHVSRNEGGPRKNAPAGPRPVDDSKARVGVTAVQLTALIPTQGEPVLYEHLLLEAGASWSLPIDARFRRRNQ